MMVNLMCHDPEKFCCLAYSLSAGPTPFTVENNMQRFSPQ